MGRDKLFVDPAADERLEHRPSAFRPEGVKPSLRQVGNARREIEAEQVRQGEVVIADAAAVGVVSSDTQVGLAVEQPVDD